MASSPAFCSPLNGVVGGVVAFPHTDCSSAGELNQKPTLKVWIGVKGEAGFSMKVSLSKMPCTLTEAFPSLLLWTSDWYQPKPNPPKVPPSSGEFWIRNISKPVVLGRPLAV